MRILCNFATDSYIFPTKNNSNAKDSYIFPTKNNSIFVIFTFKIFNKTLTNKVVTFEQPAPNLQFSDTQYTCIAVTCIMQILEQMSLVVRKPVFGVSDQVRHKPGCTVSEDGQRLEISDLGSRGIVLSV